MKKKLVFFIYIDTENNNAALNIHLENLRRCSNIFDSALFVLSLKDMDTQHITKAKDIISKITKMGYIYDVEFKIKKNSVYREAECFKEEVIDKLGENRDKAIFFGHTKGISNMQNESLFKWICSMYYFGVINLGEFNYHLVNERKLFYGFPMCMTTEGAKNFILHWPKYDYYYMGTMYWLNPNMILKIKERKGADYECSDRYFGEEYPGELFERKYASSYNEIVMTDEYNPYIGYENLLNIYLGVEDKKMFEEYYNSIMNSINENS